MKLNQNKQLNCVLMLSELFEKELIIYIKLPEISIMVRMFVNGQVDRGSIPGRVTPKTQKIDATLLNTQYYKVGIKGKVEQSRERSSAPLYTLV